MSLPELVVAAPNLAFGIICLWFMQAIQRERVSETTRYAQSLEKINALYIALLEKALNAITQHSGEAAALRSEIKALHDTLRGTSGNRA